MEFFYTPGPTAYYVMPKPIGPVCNLNCTYCYYLEKEHLFSTDRSHMRMSDEVLERYIDEYIQSRNAAEVLFTWHGGEPTLLGIDYFKKIIRLQQQYARGKVISNSLQTNGTLLTDDWCQFFKQNQFLIGLSLDGPAHCHDKYRLSRDGSSTFAKVMKGVELLQKHGVEYNILAVINSYNAQFPVEVYRFFKSIGTQFIQFTPIVERINPTAKGLQLLSNQSTTPDAQLTETTVSPEAYAQFMMAVFDDWVLNDVGKVFVVNFDCLLANRVGEPPALCTHAKTCGHAGVMEFNGDVYACDHFVFPEYYLGNIMQTPLHKLMYDEKQLQFGADKAAKLPRYCQQCDYLLYCNGDCPKNRFATTPDGEPGLNYLCKGYKILYHHVAPYMDFMAGELAAKRPPANVMTWARQRIKPVATTVVADSTPKPVATGANDPCPCGSGKKYKQCCRLKPKA